MRPASLQAEMFHSTNVTRLAERAGARVWGRDTDCPVLRMVVVDDEPDTVTDWVLALYEAGHQIAFFESSQAAVDFLLGLDDADDVVDVVLCDLRMPEPNGLQVLAALRAAFVLVPVVMLTGYSTPRIVVESVERYAHWYLRKEELNSPLLIAVLKMAAATGGALRGLRPIVRMLDEKDPYSAEHSVNVRMLSMALASEIGLTPEDRFLVGVAALLHDIGKVGIPDAILNKPVRPNDAERRTLDVHAELSFDVASRFYQDERVLRGVLYNHRTYCGTRGYPFGAGLLGRIPRAYQLPVDRPELFRDARHRFAHIIHVADAFDTMVCARAYKTPMPLAEVMRELVRCSLAGSVRGQVLGAVEGPGSALRRIESLGHASGAVEFDPALVRSFLSVVCRLRGASGADFDFDAVASGLGLESLLLTNIDAARAAWMRFEGRDGRLGEAGSASDDRRTVAFFEAALGRRVEVNVPASGPVTFRIVGGPPSSASSRGAADGGGGAATG